MLKRFFADISISLLILVMIWSAYFMTAQRVLNQATNGFELCGQVAMLEESLDKLKLRQWMVAFKDLPEATKTTLVAWYEDQIALFEEKIRQCGIVQ